MTLVCLFSFRLHKDLQEAKKTLTLIVYQVNYERVINKTSRTSRQVLFTKKSVFFGVKADDDKVLLRTRIG